MKKILLLSTLALASIAQMNAQTVLTADKTWDFGNDAAWTGFAGAPAGSTLVLKDNLGIFPHASSSSLMGQIEAHSNTGGTTGLFPDNYTHIQRLKFNGGSASPGALPTSRYLVFRVPGACKIRFWSKTTSANRNVLLGNGTATLYTLALTSTTDGFIGSYDYTGGATDIYVSNDASTNIYKIEVDLPPYNTLAVNDIKNLNDSSMIFGNGNQISLRNFESNSNVNVYSMNGTLVKKTKVTSEADLQVEPGIYIVQVSSDKGSKSVKVSVK